MNNDLILQDWYYHFAEECKATITEAVHNSRWDLVEGYWKLGELIEQTVRTHPMNLIQLYQALGETLSIHITTFKNAHNVYLQYRDINTIPEGKNISWNKLVTKYLPQQKEPETIIVKPEGVEILTLSSIQVKQGPKKRIVELYFNQEKYMWIASEANIDHLASKLGLSRTVKATCPNPAGHQDCVQYIDSVGKKFPNYAKQVHFLHKILEAKFSWDQMNKAMDEMDKDKFYQGHWDFATLSNYLGKQYAQPNQTETANA